MKNPKTTITGIAMVLIAVAVAIGWISQDKQVVIEQFVVTIIDAVAGLILIFAAGDGKEGVKAGF